MSNIKYKMVRVNGGTDKEIALPDCPLCGSDLNTQHIGNSHTKSQKLMVKCSNTKCRIERTDATIHGTIDDLIRYQQNAWNNQD